MSFFQTQLDSLVFNNWGKQYTLERHFPNDIEQFHGKSTFSIDENEWWGKVEEILARVPNDHSLVETSFSTWNDIRNEYDFHIVLRHRGNDPIGTDYNNSDTVVTDFVIFIRNLHVITIYPVQWNRTYNNRLSEAFLNEGKGFSTAEVLF